MKNEDFNALLQGLYNNELKKLSLGGLDKLDKEQINTLSEALMINLSVTFIHISSGEYLQGKEGSALFEVILKKMHDNQLTELSLILNLGTEKLRLFAGVLKNNSSLIKLMLADGVINIDMPLMVDAVLHHKALRILNLDSNFAKDISAECLSEMIKKSQTLKSLSLQGNHFHEDSIQCFEAAVKQNQSLVSLNLNNNFGSPKTVEKIATYLSTRETKLVQRFFDRNHQTETQHQQQLQNKTIELPLSQLKLT